MFICLYNVYGLIDLDGLVLFLQSMYAIFLTDRNRCTFGKVNKKNISCKTNHFKTNLIKKMRTECFKNNLGGKRILESTLRRYNIVTLVEGSRHWWWREAGIGGGYDTWKCMNETINNSIVYYINWMKCNMKNK